MLSNASDPMGGKTASGLASSLSVRSGSLLCTRQHTHPSGLENAPAVPPYSSVHVYSIQVAESTRGRYAADVEHTIWRAATARLHLVLTQSVCSKGAAGAVKGWPLLDAIRQPAQSASRPVLLHRATCEDALPHL
jgi:hypothetical protein